MAALNPEVLDSLKEDLGQTPLQRLPADTVAALKEDLSPPSMLRPPTEGIYSPVMGPGGKRVLLPAWTAFMDKPAEWTPAQKAAVAEEPKGILEKVIPYLGKAPMEPSVIGKAFDILSTPAYFPVKAALKEAIAPEAKLGRRPSVEDIVEARVGEIPWVTKPLSTIADLLLINATFPMLGMASRVGRVVEAAKGMKAAEIVEQAATTLKGLKTKPTKGLWEAFLKRREVKQAKQGIKVIAPTLRRLGEAGKPTELAKTLAEQARAGQRYAVGTELPYPLRGLVRPEWQDIGIKAPWAFKGGAKAAALFRGSRIGKVLGDILGGQLRSAASSFPDQEALARTSEYLMRGNKQLAMMELERVAKSGQLSQADKKRVFDWIEDIKKSEPPTPPPSGEIPPEFGMGGGPRPPILSVPATPEASLSEKTVGELQFIYSQASMRKSSGYDPRLADAIETELNNRAMRGQGLVNPEGTIIDVTNQMIASGEPFIKPGYIRLYRAEPVLGGAMGFKRGEEVFPEFIGRWYTSDKTNWADFYSELLSKMGTAGEGNVRLVYIDVPSSEAEAVRVVNLPDVIKYGSEINEFFVPEKWLKDKKVLEGSAEEFMEWLGVTKPPLSPPKPLPFLAAPTVQPTSPTIPFGPMYREETAGKAVAEQRAFEEAMRTAERGAREPLGAVLPPETVEVLKADLGTPQPPPQAEAGAAPLPIEQARASAVYGEPLTEVGIPKYQTGLFGQTEIGVGGKVRPTPEGQLEIGTAPSTEGIAPELVRAPITEQKTPLSMEQMEIGAETRVVPPGLPQAEALSAYGKTATKQFKTGLKAGSILEGGEVDPRNLLHLGAWRSMGPKELETFLRTGQAKAISERGGYWSWFPSYAESLKGAKGRPKYLVEVAVETEGEQLVRSATRQDIRAVWRSEGGEWRLLSKEEVAKMPVAEVKPAVQTGEAAGIKQGGAPQQLWDDFFVGAITKDVNANDWKRLMARYKMIQQSGEFPYNEKLLAHKLMHSVWGKISPLEKAKVPGGLEDLAQVPTVMTGEEIENLLKPPGGYEEIPEWAKPYELEIKAGAATKFETEARAEATVVKTTKPKLTELNPEEFATDVRLQPREALSEPDVQRMTANFNYAEFDPVLAFVPPEGGKPLVIAGHHRLEAARRLGIKVDTRLYPQGTLSWEDAVNLANKSNLNRRLLQPVETARVIDGEVRKGKSYKDISSELLGWKETTIKEMHSLVDLTPSIQRIVNEGQFPVEKILALAKRVKKYGIQPELQEDFFYNVLMKQDLPKANVEAMLDGLMPEAVKLNQTELGFPIPAGIWAQANAIASDIAKIKPIITWLKKTTAPKLRVQAEALGVKLPKAEAMLADYQGQLNALAKSIGRGVQAPVPEIVKPIEQAVAGAGKVVAPERRVKVALNEGRFEDAQRIIDTELTGMSKGIAQVELEDIKRAVAGQEGITVGNLTPEGIATVEEAVAPLPIATARKADIHIPQKVNKTAAQVIKLSQEGNIIEAERLFAEIPETSLVAKREAQDALMAAKQAKQVALSFPVGTDVVTPAGEAKVIGVNNKTGWVRTQIPGEEAIREFELPSISVKPVVQLPKAPTKVRIPTTGRTHKTVGDVLYPDQDKAITESLRTASVDGLADIAKTKGAYVRYQGHYYNTSRALLEEQRKWNEHLIAVSQQFATTTGKGAKAEISAFKTEAEAMQTQLTAKWQSLVEEYSVNQGRRPQANGWMLLPGWGRPEPPDNPETVKRAIEWVIGERTAYTEAEKVAGLLKEGQIREGYMPRYLSPRGLQDMGKWLGKKPPRGAGGVAKFQHWMDRYWSRDPELAAMKTTEVNQLAREGKLSITGLNKGKPIKVDYDLFLIEPYRVTTARKLQNVNLVGWTEYEQKSLDLSVKSDYGRKFYSDQTDEIKAFMRELTDLPEPLKGHPKTLYIPRRSAELLFGETVAERLASLPKGGFAAEGEAAMLTAEEAERILMGLKGTGKVTKKVPVYVIPQEVADIMQRIYSAVSTDKGLNWLVGSYDSALRFWVRHTLGPFLEWAMRNGVGNIWNMGILAGNTNPMNYYDAAQSEHAILTGALNDLTRVIVNQRGEQRPLGKLVGEAIRYDLYNTGFYGAETQRANILKPETYGFWAGLGETPLRRGVGLAGKAIDLPPRVGFWLNQRLENNSRLALFIDRWRKGDDFVEAADYVRKFGFDYRDLTPAEQWIRRGIYPFWSWYAKNIPLQMEMAIKRPGLFMMKEALKDDIEQGERVLPPELTSQFIRDSYHLQVRAGKTGYEALVLDNWIPFADIYRLGPKLLLTTLGPVPKLIIEQGGNINLLTGRKLEEYPGQTVPFLGRYMRGRAAQFFRNIRYLSVLDRLTRSDYNVREKIQRFIFGLKAYPIDPIAELKARKYERAQEVGALNKDIGMKERALERYRLQKDIKMEQKTKDEIAALKLKKAQVQTRPFPQLPIPIAMGER